MRTSLVLLALLAAPAWADADLARAKFDAAQSAFDLGDFERARGLYAEAYELKALPGLLFNIGQCHKKLGEWSKAAFFFRRYLARVSDDTDVSRLNELIAEMDERERAAAERPKDAPVVAPSPVQTAAKLAVLPAVTSGAVPVVAAPSAPPVIIVERESTPVYRQWWLWAGAAAVTVATVTSVVALGIAVSHPAAPAPRDGK